MHESSYEGMREFRDQYLGKLESKRLTVLDLGAMNINGCFRPLFVQPRWKYIGVDLEAGPNIDLVLRDPYRWREVDSKSVDVVISGSAFEHIEFFWLTMQELARVLKPGGLCCIIAPSSGIEHRYPVDCWRFYPDGMRALARYVNLEVLVAHTHWEDRGHKDGSDMWHDSILIARKPSRLDRLLSKQPPPLVKRALTGLRTRGVRIVRKLRALRDRR